MKPSHARQPKGAPAIRSSGTGPWPRRSPLARPAFPVAVPGAWCRRSTTGADEADWTSDKRSRGRVDMAAAIPALAARSGLGRLCERGIVARLLRRWPVEIRIARPEIADAREGRDARVRGGHQAARGRGEAAVGPVGAVDPRVLGAALDRLLPEGLGRLEIPEMEEREALVVARLGVARVRLRE